MTHTAMQNLNFLVFCLQIERKMAFVAAAGGGTQQIRIVSAGGKSLNTGKCRIIILRDCLTRWIWLLMTCMVSSWPKKGTFLHYKIIGAPKIFKKMGPI